MLVINECGLSNAAHEDMKRELCELIKNGRRAYLIVPEQQTVTAEAEMARELPECAPLYFEVTNFTRLADSIFRSLGGICEGHIDRAHRALVMWRVLTELSPKLDMTRNRSDISDGLVKKALSALDELDGAVSDEERLFALSEDSALPLRLRKKINDISLIRSLYRSILSEKYTDADDAVLRSAVALSENPRHLTGAVFFIEGFTSFTKGQLRVISELIGRSDVKLLLPLPKYDADGFEYTEIRSTRKKIRDLARGAGVDVKLHRYGISIDERPFEIEEALKLLWRSEGEIDNDSLQNRDIIRVFEAHTPFDECDFLCADIKRRVMAGASYSDFAVIARSPEEYLGVLDVALEKSGIPHFMSHTKEISQYEAIKLIYTAYAAAERFAREDVFAYMKCGFCDAARDDIDEFEIYAMRWGISGKKFLDGDVWNMNPDGYTTRMREELPLELSRINETRKKILSPLIDFSKKTRGIHTVREHAELLYSFLVDMRVEEKLRKRDDGDGGLFSVITDALDTLVEVLGDMSVSAEVFLSQLKVLFSTVRLGKIPSVIDELTVGGAELLRLSGKRHIYLLGVNDGKFPKTPKDDSYLTERERIALASYDLGIEPDLEIKCARELFFFSRAISFAKESVTILYSLTSTDFKPLQRGEIISRLSDISRGIIAPRKICELPPIERIYSPYPARELSDLLNDEERTVVDEALIASGHSPYPYANLDIENGELTLSGEGTELIYGENLNLTQTRIDSYVKCPLSYFCKYNLGLEDTKPYELSYSGIGSYVHAVLESFFKSVKESGKAPGGLTPGERERITLSASEKYLSELSGGVLDTETKILTSRLYRATLPVVEDICDELSDSRFTPEFFELNIGRGKEGLPEAVSFSYPEGRVSIYGQIDRTDVYKSGDDVYVRVVDYKTGTKRFSPEDIENGENLQMFLYLKAIIDTKNASFKERIGAGVGGKLIPAGVVYVKTSLSDVKVEHDDSAQVSAEIKKSQARQGMLLLDAASIAAQNPSYLPIKFKKDGTPTAASEKYLYTPEGWEKLMTTVEEVVGRVARRMRTGEIRAAAKGHRGERTPCEYCEYKPFCRKGNYS